MSGAVYLPLMAEPAIASAPMLRRREPLTEQIAVRLPESVHRALESLAKASSVTLAEAVREAAELYVTILDTPEIGELLDIARREGRTPESMIAEAVRTFVQQRHRGR